MAQRWTAAYVFKWTPILTFTRRRLQLLEWFEKNTEPVAFTENADRIGVALVSPTLRLSIRGGSMALSVALAEGKVESLRPAVNGVFEILEPRDVVIDLARTTWTTALDGADYHEERARFASIWAGGTTSGNLGAFRPIDASGLADLESSEWAMQAEWGVVERPELLRRLTSPGMGRIEEPRITPRLANVDDDDLPSVALFADIAGRRKVGGQVKSTDEVFAATRDADVETSTIATALYKTFTGSRGDDSGELRQVK